MSTVGVARKALDVPVGHSRGRVRSWWTGWRLALRMARRDIRRDRGRSWFVWLMIAVPVALIAASQVLIASTELSPKAWAELHTGGNQARITWVGRAFTPELSSDGHVLPASEKTTTAEPVPGWGTSIASQQDAVAKLLDSPATAITATMGAFGPSAATISLLGLDAAAPAAARIVQLTEGRLPAGPGEALVTVRGSRAGLPGTGTVTVTLAGEPVTLTIVGRGATHLTYVPDLITQPGPDAEELEFLISGDRPVTYPDAERLARHGFQTTSLHIVTHEPLPGTGLGFGIGDLAAAGGLIEVALLVGPAFAIGAARQRRSLALAATSGATARQLRRIALGQAVLLGSSATLAGMVVGAGVAIALWPILTSDPADVHGPLDVPSGHLVLLLALGTLTALGSALMTARGLGRLALISALHGTVRSAPPGRGAPIAGTLLLASGVAAAWSTRIMDPATQGTLIAVVWMTGGLAALAGVLLGTPALLRGLSRLGGSAPVTARMALRDLARQRGRATATVASVLGGVMMLTTVWTVMDSAQAFEGRHYIPTARYGQGTVDTAGDTDAGMVGIEASVHSVDPALRTARLAGVAMPTPGVEGDFLTVVAVRKGCATPELLEPSNARCRSMIAGFRDGILMGSPADLTRLFGLDAGQADALRNGRLLVNTQPVQGFNGTSVNEVTDGRLRLAYIDQMTPGAKPRTVDVPALAVTSELIDRGVPASRYSVLVSTRTAAALGWEAQGWHVLVDDPNGPISADTALRLNASLDEAGLEIHVERGFVPTPQPLMWLIAGTLALLAVIGAATSTILATAELRPFLATFTAVGAPPTLTRRLATTQAATLALLATTLGSALGIAVGAPMALFATDAGAGDPILALPWPVVGAFVIAVPVVAGAVAAVSTSATRSTAGSGTNRV